MIRVYPSDQNVSQLLPTPTVGPGTPTPTPVPTSTPTPTPTPVPGIPISTPNLRLYSDGQSISYPGTGTTWFNLATPGIPGVTDLTLIQTPTFNRTPTKNFFSFEGLEEWAHTYAYGGFGNEYDYSYTWGGWYRLSRGPVNKPLLAFGIGLFPFSFMEFIGCSLNLYKNENDYPAVQVFLQIDSTPSTPTILTGATITSTTKMPNDEWCYVVASYAKNSQVKIYLNGVLTATGAAPSNGHLLYPYDSVGWNLCYGGYLGDQVGFKLTRMDVGDVEVYQTVLNATEILNNYNAQKSKYI